MKHTNKWRSLILIAGMASVLLSSSAIADVGLCGRHTADELVSTLHGRKLNINLSDGIVMGRAIPNVKGSGELYREEDGTLKLAVDYEGADRLVFTLVHQDPPHLDFSEFGEILCLLYTSPSPRDRG